MGDIKERNNSWKNKYGYQLGGKNYYAFKVNNLQLQLEYNHVRPDVYLHSIVITNCTYNNQSIGYQLGGNFKEFIAIARYHKGRFFADTKFTAGTQGFDFDTLEDVLNY